MKPFDALTNSDLSSLSSYIDRAVGKKPMDVSDVLREWNASKSWLFANVFGGKLRVSIPVKASCNRNTADIMHGIARASLGLLQDFVDFMYGVEQSKRAQEGVAWNAIGMFSYQSISNGRLEKDMLFLDGDESLYLQKGTRIMRAIRRVMEFYEYGNMEAFERFRDQVSAIKTTSSIDSEVVLSIHPIDFLSMSDNANGWTTCTSILGHGACAIGAIEMMNSPTAVVCYIQSKKPYLNDVPNKSWRMLCFVDEESETVLGGRQYPYFSEELAEVAVKTLGQMSTDKSGAIVRPYPSNDFERCACETLSNEDIEGNTLCFEEVLRTYPDDLGIVPYSSRMCNDFLMFAGNDRFYKYSDGTEDGVVGLSGLSTCLLCGCNIDSDDLVCYSCQNN